MENKYILEQISISQTAVNKWKKAGLKISYPMVPKKHFFKSHDGYIFIESADKYCPPLSKKETQIFTKNPLLFKTTFLENARFFIRFCDYLVTVRSRIDHLDDINKISALLAFLYIFQSAMDHHYYHFDKYLVYEEYSKTPVGYWWQKLKDYYHKVYKVKVDIKKPTPEFLLLLGQDKNVVDVFKKTLTIKEFASLRNIFKMIKIFENAQQEEVAIVMDVKTNEHKFMRTGFPAWNKLKDLIKINPQFVDKNSYKKIVAIMEGNPILETRNILSPRILIRFDKYIYDSFENEVNRWL